MSLKRVSMRRDRLDDVPEFGLPAGYRLRRYRPGDETQWVVIHRAAEEHVAVTDETFRNQFGSDADTLAQRQFYVVRSPGEPVATATAWLAHDRGPEWGRVHWVAVVPQEQRKGLAKAMLSAVCRRLGELGCDRAYLTTQTIRIAAIGLYLSLGFVPEVKSEEERAAWVELRDGGGPAGLARTDLDTIRTPA